MVTTDLIPRFAKLPRKNPQVKTKDTGESSKYCLEAEMALAAVFLGFLAFASLNNLKNNWIIAKGLRFQ